MVWTPIDVVVVGLALSGALTTAAVTIIAALKGTAAQAQAVAAQAQSAANQQAIAGLAARVQGHEQQLTTLAIHVPSPGGSVPPPSAGAANAAAPAVAAAAEPSQKGA